MNSSALLLAPLPVPTRLEPLLDFMWHYECVVSPRSLSNSLPSLPTSAIIQIPPQNQQNLQPESSTISPMDGFQTPSVILVAGESTRSWSNRSAIPSSSNGLCASPTVINDLSTGTNGSACFSLSSTGSGDKNQETEVEQSPCLAKPTISISYAERQWLERVFHTFDENNDGKISKDELGRSLEKLGISMKDEAIVFLLSSTSLKVEGYVDKDEFLLMYSSTCTLIQDSDDEDIGADNDQDLLEAFHVFDKDNNGFISPAELQSVLCSLGFPQGQKLDACVEMIKRVDEDGDGQVDFSEFKRMLDSAELICVRC